MSKYSHTGAALAFAFTALFTTTALADDWTAIKLRGVVLGLFDGEWVKLQRGAIIPDDQPIRTLASGRVTFERGEETIDLGPNTQVQIFDRAGYDKYTTVKQYFGRVAVEAEVRKVKHFAVQTPHLAAVVKGTRFVVISDADGATVEVERGAVAVENAADHSAVVLAAGQEVTAPRGELMSVSGRGELPQVVGANGKPVVAANGAAGRGQSASSNAAEGAANAASGIGNANANAGGGNGNAGQGGSNASSNASQGSGNSGDGGSGNGGASSGSSNGNSGGNGKGKGNGG